MFTRQRASLCCPGTGSRASSPRAQEDRKRCPCWSTDLYGVHPPATHPTPARIPSVAVFSREARKESKLRIVLPRGGQMPPRHPCRPDRDAFGPASRPACYAVSACRRFSRPRIPPATPVPRPVGPHRESPQSESAASSQAPGHPPFTAVVSFGGRMPSASIVPPGSWPCCPSTLRLSRLPQPSSRRIVQAGPRPSTRRSPRHFAVAFRGCAATHARKTPCHIETTINQLTTNQAPV